MNCSKTFDIYVVVVDLDLKPYLSLGRNEILRNPQSDADGMILRSEIKQSNSALTAITTDDTWCNLDNGNVTVVAPPHGQHDGY